MAWLGSIAALLFLLFCFGVIASRQDLVVGDLEPARIALRRYTLFEPVLLAAVLVFGVAGQISRPVAEGMPDPLATLSTAALSLTAPAWIIVGAVLFGQELRPSLYPHVAVRHGEREPPVCGLLVVATEGTLRVWHIDFEGDRPRGLVTSFQAAAETIVEFGRVEDIFTAAEGAMRTRKSIACPA